MKRLKRTMLGILSATLLSAGLYSCSNDDATDASNTMNYSINATSSDTGLRLPLTQLEELGKKHNEWIVYSFNNIQSKGMELNSTNVINEFKEINVDLSPIGTSVREVVDKSIRNSHLTLRNIRLDESLFTVRVYQYLSDIDESITGDYFTTINNLNVVKRRVISDESINANDFNLLVGTVEVAKNSAELWMNSPLSQSYKTLATDPPKDIVKADAAASSAYFVGIGAAGLVGLGTPVTAGAVLGGWAISAAIGSAYHYIGLE